MTRSALHHWLLLCFLKNISTFVPSWLYKPGANVLFILWYSFVLAMWLYKHSDKSRLYQEKFGESLQLIYYYVATCIQVKQPDLI